MTLPNGIMMNNRDKRNFFEKNLQLLSVKDLELCSRLSSARTTQGRYKILESRTGRVVPAIVDLNGQPHALHSTVDPEKEAQRLAATLNEGWAEPGFVVFLGLGAAYAAAAALSANTASHILVIDFDINGIAELFSSCEYAVLGDSRFTLLVDPNAGLIQETILALYNPCLYGGIRVLPLRGRVDWDKGKFAVAGEAVQRTIEKVSADYSVQAHFGIRWFSNIIRNIGIAQSLNRAAPQVSGADIGDAAICAAGPSLDAQIPILRERRRTHPIFVIAADTCLPALLAGGVKPDAIVSIDCQHISYCHFIGTDCADIPLFLDIASPPLLSGFSRSLFFFRGGHPLAAYLCLKWRLLPPLDTSGGNVTYACLSLAEQLGARRITVYGADFSYPLGKPYARGTYFYPLFERKQNRLSPLEAGISSFLYRSPFLPLENEGRRGNVSPCYETTSLRFYRKSFEEKASAMEAEVSAEAGLGIPLEIRKKTNKPLASGRQTIDFAPGKPLMDSRDFLDQYRKDIKALPVFGRGMNLSADESQVFTTLLPLLAAIKRRQPELATSDLVEAAKTHCVKEIEKLHNPQTNQESP
jgi:uncharacterized Rossmann fold enzyme